MPRITSVEPQKKNPHRFNIYLDGQFTFGADEDLVVEHRLVVGKEVQPVDVEKLIWEAEVGKLMERVYALFDRRQRSEKEVRDYLRNLSFKRKVKGKDEISQAAIDLVVEKLKQKKLVDDREFARAWIESRKEYKKKGRSALKAELYQKGIEKEVIEEVLESELSRSDEEKLAKDAIYKRHKRWQGLPLIEQKRRAYEYLARQGFSYDLIREVVDKMLGSRYNDLE